MIKTAGVPTPLIDGIDKVTGTAKYTTDLDATNALVGKILRSRWSHANIRKMDISAAQALPGVVAVLTGDDCASTFGILPITEDEYALAKGRVRYKGDPIAAVAAIDEETAQRALALIDVDVEELPAYYTSTEARQLGAVDIHENRPGNLLRDQAYELGGEEKEDGCCAIQSKTSTSPLGSGGKYMFKPEDKRQRPHKRNDTF